MEIFSLLIFLFQCSIYFVIVRKFILYLKINLEAYDIRSIIRGQRSNFYLKNVFDTYLPANLMWEEIFLLPTKIFSLAKTFSAHKTNVAKKFIFSDVMMIVGKNTFMPTFFSWPKNLFLLTWWWLWTKILSVNVFFFRG